MFRRTRRGNRSVYVKAYLILVCAVWLVGAVCLLWNGAVDDGAEVSPAARHAPAPQARADAGGAAGLAARGGGWGAELRARYDPNAVEPADVLFLWVNGTDPAHIAAYERATGRRMTAAAMRRFRDYGTLRFGVRSVEKFVPFMRRLHIVTSGQVPSWWNPANPRGRIVTHEEIFVTKEDDENDIDRNNNVGNNNNNNNNNDNGNSDSSATTTTRPKTKSKPISGALPTFNSNAIEANLRNVPGLAKYVLYLNDDFLVGAPLALSDFVDLRSGLLRLNMGGFVAPNDRGMRTNIWHRSVGHANTLVNSVYHPGSPRAPHQYAGHVCYFLDRDVLEHMHAMWPAEFLATSRRKFRDGNDTSLPFLMVNVALEERLGTRGSPITSGYATWTHRHRQNVAAWDRLVAAHAKCLCIQDGFEDSPSVDAEVAFLERKLCQMFPEKSSFERPDEPNPCDKYKDVTD